MAERTLVKCIASEKKIWKFRNSIYNQAKLFSIVSSEGAQKLEDGLAKPFECIPALPRLPLIGHLHHFGKFGRYSFERLHNDAFPDLHRKYGPIVRLDLGIKMVALFDPNDIEKLYRMESTNPRRPVFEALKKYRQSKKHMYSSAGLTSENGEEWYRLRKSVNFMMKPQFAHLYLPHQEDISELFVRRIRQLRNDRQEIPDFLHEIYRYTEEAIGFVCFGTRLGLLETSNTSANKKGLGMIQATEDYLQALSDTLLGFPWWKFFKTPTYKKMERAQDYANKFAMECVHNAKSKIETEPNGNDTTLLFLKRLLSNPDLTMPDISLQMTEIFGAGIDTTGNTIGFLLYNLSKRPDAQEKIFQEMQRYNLDSQPVTPAILEKLKYLKACIKESHRLTPSPGGSARILSTTAVFSGYRVPENVLCIGINPTISRLAEHFEDPLSYKPERWINSENGEMKRAGHPYCVLPFGHGIRRCIGQRFADQEIKLCIMKIIQNFEVKYDGPEIGNTMKLLLTPDQPLNFRFIDRKL